MKRSKRTTRRQRKDAQHAAAVMWRDALHGRMLAVRDEASSLGAVNAELAEGLRQLGEDYAELLAQTPVPAPKYTATVTLTGDAAGFEREVLRRLDGN